MTLSQEVKSHGYKSVAEFAELTGKGVETIRRWRTDNPRLFKVVLEGFKEWQ